MPKISLWFLFAVVLGTFLYGLFAVSRENACTGVREYSCAAKKISSGSR